MEKLENIGQLAKGDKFIRICGDEVTEYEFLCIHPHNNEYILAINGLTESGDKLYIRHMLSGGQYYVGETDMDFVNAEILKYYKGLVNSMETNISGKHKHPANR